MHPCPECSEPCACSTDADEPLCLHECVAKVAPPDPVAADPAFDSEVARLFPRD